MLIPRGYLGSKFSKMAEKAASEQANVREKAALYAAKKYYTPEEFEQLMADLSTGQLTVQIFDDGIVIAKSG